MNNMFSNPLVSIIIPVYNAEKYLSKSLNSIINQTYANLEIIIIDDGSTDNSIKICDEYLKIDKRILLIHNTNHGVSYSRNYGIELAKGEYLTFIDSDDYVDLNYIENLLKPIKEDDYDLVVCNFNHVYSNKILKNVIDINELSNNYLNDFYFLKTLRMAPWCKLFNAEIIRLYNIRFPENIDYAEDRIFNYKFAEYVKKYRFINEATYYYCHRENNSLSQKKNLDTFEDAVYSLKKEKEFSVNKNVKNKELLLTDTAIGILGNFSVLNEEIGMQYEDFYNRIQKIRSILNGCYFHKVLKRKLVAICLKHNIIFPLYVYYCILK